MNLEQFASTEAWEEQLGIKVMPSDAVALRIFRKTAFLHTGVKTK